MRPHLVLQTMGACRVFKLTVRGLPLCRLIARWIKSGKINGLPRKGVKMSFRLLGEPVQQPSLMQADLGRQLAASGRGGNAQKDSAPPAAAADGRHRYHDWERQQRARRQREDAAAGGLEQACADADAACEGAGQRDGVQGEPERVREENATVAAPLPVHRAGEAADDELDSTVFSACCRPGEWGDGADIKARLHHWQKLLCAGRA